MKKQPKSSISKERSALLNEQADITNQLGEFTNLIRGSIFSRFSTCSRPSCSCHEGKRHGPRYYVVTTQGTSQRQHYIPNSQVDNVKRSIKEFNDLMALIDRLTAINLKLIRDCDIDWSDKYFPMKGLPWVPRYFLAMRRRLCCA